MWGSECTSLDQNGHFLMTVYRVALVRMAPMLLLSRWTPMVVIAARAFKAVLEAKSTGIGEANKKIEPVR